MSSSGSKNTFDSGFTLGKAQGIGAKVDIAVPTYPWLDLLGNIKYDPEAAANRPDLNVYRGNIKQYQFAASDQAYLSFHMPHDYVPGTDIFIHAHWSHISTTVTSGSVTWGFEASYAKGHNRGAFSAPVTPTILQAASTVQYRHLIAETQLSAAGGAGSLLVTENLEPDGVVLVRAFLSANTISAAANPFMHYCDLHYQSTGIGTKQKAPDFYI
jgi:hypothetical protein